MRWCRTGTQSNCGESLMLFTKITVLGAGTMGHGIAQVCAMAGYSVCLTDQSQEQLELAMTKIDSNLKKGLERGKVSQETYALATANLETHVDLATAVQGAELVIEAIPENLELKQRLFRIIDENTADNAILATNTSSLSVEDIASVVSDPSRVIGLHFFNPVHIMKLLEIVYHSNTDKSVISACESFAETIGKESILVRNTPGFATSRLGVAIGMEAIRMLEEGVASAADIDKAMVLGYRHPVGPLRLTDMVGLDVRLAIGEYLAKELGNPAFEPPKLLRSLVEQGKLGKKTKEGFYRW